jgi:putative DNA primase/helicase
MPSQVLINEKHYGFFDIAESYVNYGFSVIPLRPNDQTGRDTYSYKKPIVSWSKFQNEIPSRYELSSWFSEGNNNIGIVTGKISDIAVLDIDSDEAYELALAKGLPDTPTVKTGRGHHLYFRYKDGVRNFQCRDDIPGIDLRGEGGYVVAPPTKHHSGVRYQWVEGKGLEDLPRAELPDWVLAKAPEEKKPLVALADGASKGSRNESLTRLLGSWVKTMSWDEVVSKALEWNQTCDPPDNEQQVMRTVNSIWEAEHAGLPDDIGIAWEEPVLFDTEALPAITADIAPGVLGEFASAVSRSIQASEGMALMLGLSVAATALQKKIVVGPDAHGDYVEPVNVWSVVVADPSERKSPVLREMMAPIIAWETEQAVSLHDRQNRVQAERDVINARIKKLRTDAGNADRAEDRNALLDEIEEMKNSLPDEVNPPVMWTGNTTTERLEQLMVENNEKMAVMTDEGGIFEVMAGLYNNGKVNLDIYMQGYSGNPTRMERASRCAHMNNPLLTIGLAVQPKVLQDLSRGSKRVFRGNGLLARFLYYNCESHRGRRWYANQQQVSVEIRNRYSAGVKQLLEIPLENDGQGNVIPRRLHLNTEAKAAWVVFHDEVEKKLAPGSELDNFSDWAGKLPGNTLRVAGLFHAVEHGVTVRSINRETMEKAIQLMRLLIPHAQYALSATTTSDITRDAEAILGWIVNHEHREFAKRDLQRGMQSRFQTAKDLEPVLSELNARHIIRVKPSHKRMGRPPTHYEANPVIFE